MMKTAHVMKTYKRLPVEFVSGSGVWLTDTDGNRYLDLLGGLAVQGVGHCHPKVTEAIVAQAGRLVHTSNLYLSGPQGELAEKIADLSSGMVSFFANSGTEAVECALKVARKWGRSAGGDDKTTVIATDGGFHGRTMGALAATGQPAKQAPFRPLPEGFAHVAFGDVAALRAAMSPAVAAVIVEPIQGEGGVVVPPSGYLKDVRDLCDEYSSLMIVDEVQTGMGRTGAWWAHEHDAITPDVMTIGKAVAGGLPDGRLQR